MVFPFTRPYALIDPIRDLHRELIEQIIIIYKNANTTATLILSYYLKIDTINS